MLKQLPHGGAMVLIAGMVLMLVLGSVHAFSVFLEPLEARFSASRSTVSITYSLALACLTVSVLFGHVIYGRLRPAFLVTFICLLAAAGCVVAATATSLPMVWLGYSVMFGAANGLGYGFALQSSAQANPRWKGLAMGLITACYALGAVISPVFFEKFLNEGGFPGAMVGLAIALVVITPFVVILMIRARAELQFSSPLRKRYNRPDRKLITRLWLGYGSAVAAGLMAIGHATGIARAGNLSDVLVLSAPITIAAFNMLGSLLGGWFSDRATNRQLLMTFPALSVGALFLLASINGGVLVLLGLAMIGFSYGAIIATYPVIAGTLFGAVDGVRAYGRIFTAWGIAGLLAPVFAGFLFEQTGNYQTALIVAGCAGLLSLATVWNIPAKRVAV